MNNKFRAVAVALLAGGMLAGCGVTLNQGSGRGQDEGFGVTSQAGSAMERDAQSLGFPSTGMDGAPHQFLRRGAAKLGLTDDQKQKLKDIANSRMQDRGQHRADFQKYRDELKTLLLADKVDEGALRAFIAARGLEASRKAADGADSMAEMRSVLTEKQRADLVTMLQEKGAKQDVEARRKKMEERIKPRLEALRKSLNLTAEQAAAVDALKGKLLSARGEERPQMKQAALAFIQTGDKAALVKAMQDGIGNHVPADELVKAASLLDKDQRTKLVERFGQMAKRMKHGQHGFGMRGHGAK